MANRLELGQVVVPINMPVTITGEDKLEIFAKTLNSMTRNNNYAAYWKEQSALIRDVADAAEKFNKTNASVDAKHLINSFNALKAVSDESAKSIISDSEQIAKTLQGAIQRIGSSVVGEMSVENFKGAFESFNLLKAYGLETEEIFKRMTTTADVDVLRKQIEELTSSYASATRQVERLREQNERLSNGVELDRLREVEAQYHDLLERMQDEFAAFLQSNDLDPTRAWYRRFGQLFEQIANGSLTAKEAITQVKDEYAALIQEGQAGGKVFSDAQVNEFITKLDEACVKIEEMRNEMRTLTDTAALRQVAQGMAESADLTDRQREALKAMVTESSGLTTVAQLLAELVKTFDATEHETVEATTALTNMLEKLNEIASIGEDGLHGVSSMFRSLDTITNIEVDTKKIQSLIGALKDIADIPNLAGLQALQNITLRGFDNMRVSKASLSNLATYLPDIARVDMDKLRALSDVNLTNFNALSVKKPSVDNLKSLFEALGALGVNTGTSALDKEGAAVNDVNKLYESHVSALKAAADAEKAKAAVSGEVSTALRQESAAANAASEAAEKDAAAAKRHNDAQRSVINTLKNVQSAIHKLENTSGGKEQPLYRDLKDLEDMLIKLNDASGKMSAKQIIQELSELKLHQSDAAQAMNLFVTSIQDLERAENEYANETNTMTKANDAMLASADRSAAELEKLYEDMLKLKDGAKISTEDLNELINCLRIMRDPDRSMDERIDAQKRFANVLESTKFAVQEMAAAEKQEAQAKKDSAKAENDMAAAERRRQQLLKQAEGLLQKVTRAQENWSKAQNNPATRGEYRNLETYKTSLNRLINELKADSIDVATFDTQLRILNADFAHTATVIQSSGSAIRSYFSTGLQQLASRMSYTFGFAAIVTKSIAEIRKMISTAVELDTAMNQLQIVTRSSTQDMENYARSVSQIAKETAQSTKDLIDATTVYARLGYTIDESKTLAKYTAMLQNVGNIDASAAQDAMTAIIKAFDKDVTDVEDVMNKMVVVGNNFPISVSQVAEGMNNAGSMLHVAGNTLEQSIALLTASNVTVKMCRAA